MDSQTRNRPSLSKRLLSLLLVIVGGALVAVGLTFAVGSLMAPYEGEGGFAGFLMAVIGNAFQGRPGALALLLSPTVAVLIWWLVIRFWKPRPRAVNN